MSPELEKLIEFALADGVITDKEREIIRRKAEKLGEDPDEAEMILDAKLAMQNNDAQASAPPPFPTPPPVAAAPPTSPPPPSMPPPSIKQKSSKVGDIMTCPACGSPVESFQTKCTDCGHEFRNIQSASSIKQLYANLQNAEIEERNRTRSWAENLDGELGISRAVANKQKSIISSFTVPNSKEDILEFLSIAISEAKKKVGFDLYGGRPETILKKAWKAKCEQLILKARIAMKDDKITLSEIQVFAKQLGIK